MAAALIGRRIVAPMETAIRLPIGLDTGPFLIGQVLLAWLLALSTGYPLA